MRILWTAPLCLTLAACGGTTVPVDITAPSEPTDQTTNPPTGDAETGTQMRAGANSLLGDYADPVSFSTISSIPSALTATYQGYAYGTLSGNPDTLTDTLLGTLTMNIDLSSNAASINGQITDFVDDGDNAITGELDITGGTFDRAGDPNANATLNIDFSGTLTDAGQTLNVGGELQGDFLGADHDGVGGKLLGRVNGYDINGGFIAER